MNVQEIIARQQPDGLWGDFFHTLAVPTGRHPLTTEQALRRLRILGLTAADAPIARTLDTLRATLRGEFDLPDHREVTHDWNLFTQLMMSTWIRLFMPDDPDACAFADRWAQVLEAAFASGTYDHQAYLTSYAKVFGKPPRGDRFTDFASFYIVSLVANRLTPACERAMFEHLLRLPGGIYYIYDGQLDMPPEVFQSLAASRYLAALELLALYDSPQCKEALRFAAAWLEQNRGPDGWDFGPKAKDGIYFPRSDSWRTKALRVADCTARIEAFLARM